MAFASLSPSFSLWVFPPFYSTTHLANAPLSLNSKMREKHHRPQPLLVIRQIIECRAKHVDQFLQRGKDQIVEVFLTQFLPQMFHGIDLWTIGGLKDEANVFWHLELFGAMPAGLIDLHHDKIVGKDLGHMRQEEIHHSRISRGQNQRGHQSLLGSDGSVDIARLANDLARSFWPDPRRGPCASGDADAAKASLILRHLQHGASILWGSGRDCRFNRGREVFLN